MHFAEMMPPPQMLTLISAANNTLRMSFAEGGKSLATNGLYAKLETFDYLTVFFARGFRWHVYKFDRLTNVSIRS